MLLEEEVGASALEGGKWFLGGERRNGIPIFRIEALSMFITWLLSKTN